MRLKGGAEGTGSISAEAAEETVGCRRGEYVNVSGGAEATANVKVA